MRLQCGHSDLQVLAREERRVGSERESAGCSSQCTLDDPFDATAQVSFALEPDVFGGDVDGKSSMFNSRQDWMHATREDDYIPDVAQHGGGKVGGAS